MPCFFPRSATRWRGAKGGRFKIGPPGSGSANPDGSPRVVPSVTHEALVLPCGSCVWCRLDTARQRAIRATHELKMHDTGCFLTLTYSPEKLPMKDGVSVFVKQHLVDFVKRLRSRLEYDFDGLQIKTMGCAEYGEQFGRPHFHLLVFGFDFPDKYFWQMSGSDWDPEKRNPIYRSNFLEELWTLGHSSIGALTEQSAHYVARYITKKISGTRSSLHYGPRSPETLMCSSKDLGLSFFLKYQKEILANDSVFFRNRSVPIPRYYLRHLKAESPLLYSWLLAERGAKFKAVDIERSSARLAVKHQCFKTRISKLKGSLK